MKLPLRMMDEVTAQHASNPEVWGRNAALLFQNEKPEDAEKALDKSIRAVPDLSIRVLLWSPLSPV